MRLVGLFTLVLATVLLPSCAEDLLGLGLGVCELDGVCMKFSEGVSNAEATAGCTALKSNFNSGSSSFSGLANASCPTANSVGTCSYTNVSSTSGTATYYSTTFNATSAQTSCTNVLSGTFTSAR